MTLSQELNLNPQKQSIVGGSGETLTNHFANNISSVVGGRVFFHFARVLGGSGGVTRVYGTPLIKRRFAESADARRDIDKIYGKQIADLPVQELEVGERYTNGHGKTVYIHGHNDGCSH